MQEIRQFPRKRVIARGEILTEEDGVSYTGSLFNISDGGVMISIPYGYQFPAMFRFRVFGQHSSRPATVAWQSSGLAGLKFVG